MAMKRNSTFLVAFALVALLAMPLFGAFIDYGGMGPPHAFSSLIVCGTVKGCTGPAITRVSSTVLGIPGARFTDLDLGLSGTAGSLDIFPATAAKGKLRITAADSAGDTTTSIVNASQSGARTYTIPDAGESASFVFTEGTQTINDAKTFGGTVTYTGAVVRTSYTFQTGGFSKVGATAGWVVGAAANLFEATLPQSQTGSTMVVPVTGLHIGDTITGYGCLAQIESAGGTVTFDTNLRSLTNVAADPTDASVGSTTQVSVTADTAAAPSVGSLADVVAAGERFYILVTSTTAGSTDVRFLGCNITVTTS
jgi:hypothetical protein